MANTNPFYVEPGNNFMTGLHALSQSLQQYGEIRRAKEKEEKEEAELEEAKKDVMEAYESGDLDALNKAMIKHPEFAGVIEKARGFRDEEEKKSYMQAALNFRQDPNEETAREMAESRRKYLDSEESGDITVESSLEQFEKNPEKVFKSVDSQIAMLATKDQWSAYKDAVGIKETKPYTELGKLETDLANGLISYKDYQEKKETLLDPEMKKVNTYMNLLNTDPEKAKAFGDAIGVKRVTPYSDLAKIKTDFSNGIISIDDYRKQRNKILNPTMKNKTELTMAAMRGDPEAKAVLEKMAKDEVAIAQARSEATTKGKLTGLYDFMDLDAVVNAILTGRETIDGVKNTFGVPIQEVVRKMVLAKEPNFNFVQPRAIQKSLSASLSQQQKNRGAMGSFVANINGQLAKVEEIMQDVIKRVGVRALDLPFRELHTRAKGSGDEQVLQAYMKEISVEIFKLSQGSTASVALLPEKGREEWERIHDVNLSYPELKKVLEGTKEMANIRLKSVNDEIKTTIKNLENTRNLENPYSAKPGEPGAEDIETPESVINELPSGSKQIGTSNGKPVYETPDGERYIGE